MTADDRGGRDPYRPSIVVQVWGIVRKELTAIVHQPWVILVLVLGPFAVLGLFAVGFDPQQNVLTTTFVGPEGSIYEQKLDEFEDELEEYLEVEQYTSDVIAARDQLVDGDVDLVVVLPADPSAAVLTGERAEVEVLHDKIDPIQQTAVEVSTEVAIQELNARILEAVVAEAQASLVPFGATLESMSGVVGDLGDAVAAGDVDESARLLAEADDLARTLSSVVALTDEVTVALDGEAGDDVRSLAESTVALEESIGTLAESPEQLTVDDVERLQTAIGDLRDVSDGVATIDPTVVIRPFSAQTAALERRSITLISFFSTGAIALLVQHLVLTFAAISLVADRSMGLFELFRVGPVGAGRILAGKYAAFATAGAFVTASVVGLTHVALDVPFRGDVGWLVAGLGLMIVASIGLGSVLSLVSTTTTQAVQYSLLALLAGLFFGGFFLDLDSFVYPFKAIVWLFPVTYGTRLTRDVMLRGDEPELVDLLGLGATSVAFAALAWFLLARKLSVR